MVEADAKSGGRVTAPPPSPADSGAEPVIDFAHLARMTWGDKNLEAEVLSLFDRQAELLLARMNGAPVAAVAAFAHTIKGSARSIGAWQVARAAEAVEHAAKAADPGSLADTLRGLARAVETARAVIVHLRPTA